MPGGKNEASSGRSLSPVKAVPEATESFEVAVLPFDKMLHLVLTGRIRNSITMIAVLHAAQLRTK